MVWPCLVSLRALITFLILSLPAHLALSTLVSSSPPSSLHISTFTFTSLSLPRHFGFILALTPTLVLTSAWNILFLLFLSCFFPSHIHLPYNGLSADRFTPAMERMNIAMEPSQERGGFNFPQCGRIRKADNVSASSSFIITLPNTSRSTDSSAYAGSTPALSDCVVHPVGCRQSLTPSRRRAGPYEKPTRARFTSGIEECLLTSPALDNRRVCKHSRRIPVGPTRGHRGHCRVRGPSSPTPARRPPHSLRVYSQGQSMDHDATATTLDIRDAPTL
ncbi:hypothetical protein BU17DRAFT_93505 [Hysterangium stoloniferum]|nr:hypothetical protein BU17DRAFT_93505 [Hysterangium stoloniferum]